MSYLITVYTPYFVYTQYCSSYIKAMDSLKDLLLQKEKLKSKFDITLKAYSKLITITQKQVA